MCCCCVQVRRATQEEILFAQAAVEENAAAAAAAGTRETNEAVADNDTASSAVAATVAATGENNANFEQYWTEYFRETQGNHGIVEEPPAGTVCTQCKKAIDAGQRWHKACVTCNRPVHASAA